MKHVCCGGKGGVVRACMHVRAFWCAIYLTEHVLYRAIYLHRTCSIQSKFYIHTDASPLQHEGESGVEDKARRDGHTSTMYTEHVLYRTCSICLLQMPRHYNTKERAAPRTRRSKRAIYLHRTRSIQNMFYMFTTRRRERRRGQGRAREPYIYTEHVLYRTCSICLQHEGESGAEDKAERDSQIALEYHLLCTPPP